MPDVSLNGIEFQIKGNSDKASNSIDSLIKNLNSLKSALAATNSVAKGTGTFKELAVSIKGFNDALKGGSERYKKFAQGLEDIAAAAELLGEKTQHISDLATSMEKLSNSKISGAAFKNLADGMAAVGFATKFISKEALDNLERMATSLSKLAGVDLKGLGSAMNAVGRGKTLEPPSPVPSETQDVINSGDQIDLLRLKLGELQAALQSAFEKGDLTGSIRIRQQIASVEAEIRKLEEAANEVVPTMGRFREALSSIGSFLGKCAGTAKKVFSAFGKVLAFPFTRAAKDIGGYAKSIWGVVSGFKRIVGYRLIRSIIREVTQAFSEGIKNLYGWSTLVGGKFATSMNQISTSLLYFKNSLAAAVAPIVNALAPAIDFLIDKIVALINIINQLFAKLTGASSWTAAKKKATEYGDAVSGAGGAAKEALKYLAPFDELNRLPDENKGGGGSSNAEDYSGMFEEMTQFSEGISDFAENVRTAIENGNWSGLGTYLGAKFNQLIDDVDWSGIGAKVGEKINSWFTTEFFTLKTVNFQNIGKSIAELLTGDDGIGGALRQIDFSNIGGIFAEKTMIIPELIVGAINQLDFGVVGDSLGDFVKGFMNDLADQINKIDWGTTMGNLVTGIVNFIKGLDINGIVESILKLTGSIIGAVIEGIGPLLVDLADTLTSPDTWKLVTAWLADLPAKMKQAGISAINALGDPIIDGLNSLIEKINSSGLAKALGIEVEPIEFQLIPDIPKEELTKNYDKAKAEIEAQSKQKPSSLSATANINSSKDNLSNKDKTFDTTANWKNNSYEGWFKKWQGGLPWDAKANWMANSYGTNWFQHYKGGLVWDSKANWMNNSYVGWFKGWQGGLPWDAKAEWKFTKDNLTEDQKTIKVTAKYTRAVDALSRDDDDYKAHALGGAYYGGSWHSIPQYARGGRPHGTMFWAGEAGPEVVGHVGGRTEVLNQSQLAATMYASVSAALSGLRFAMTAPAAPDGGMGGSDDALYNAFVRALESADFAVDNTINMDGDTVYRGVVRRNQQRRRQLGYNPMLT